MQDNESQSKSGAGTRTDARRNRQRILLAARELLAMHGSKVPFDTIARHAGVGNATLYRHFPTRGHLARAVGIDVEAQTAEAAMRAVREEPDGFAALARYMHQAIDLRIAAVMPIVVDELPGDAEILRATQAGAAAAEHLFEAARASGHLRPDVTVADIGLLLVRLSRPIPQLPQETSDALAHRHLDLVLDGLRVGGPAAATALAGPALDFNQLRDQAEPGTTPATGDAAEKLSERRKET